MKVAIDYPNIKENIAVIYNETQKEIIAVVKNNGYGLGLIPVVEQLIQANVKMVALLSLTEALLLREHFPKLEILLLNPLQQEDIITARRAKLTLMIPSFQWLQMHEQALENISLHLKIDSGMQRFGVKTLQEAQAVIELCQKQQLELNGLYTHFPQAETEVEIHQQEVTTFVTLAKKLMQMHKFSVIHAENSCSLLYHDHQLDFCTHVRPGILVYGYNPYTYMKQLSLKPTVSIQAKVIELQQVTQEVTLGYGQTVKVPAMTKLAIIDIGYGDGILKERMLDYPVYIGTRAYQCVRVIMSHSYIIVDDDVQVGACVEIYGNRLSIDTVAESLNLPVSQQLTILNF